MKLEETDPPRLAEDGASELGRLMRLSANEGMSAQASAKIAQRLQSAGAFADNQARPSGSLRGLFERMGSTKFALVALVAIGGGVVTWRSQTSVREPTTELPRSAETPAVVTTANLPTAQAIEIPSVAVDALPSSVAAPFIGSPTTSTVATPSAVAPVAPVTIAAARAVPHPSPAAPAVPAVIANVANASTANTGGPSEAEFALIRRAQRTLASDPAGALALVDEHVRTFPTGELVQERELSAVEALAHLGRKAEATSRARALLTRFPRTPYVARLERALGPLPPRDSQDQATIDAVDDSKTAR